MTDFRNWVFDLEDIGFFDIALPFLLVFTITFAILQNIKILGKNSKNINAVFSLILAFFFVQDEYLIFILRNFLPNVSMIFVVLVMLLLVMALFLGKEFEGFTSWGMVGATIAAGILVLFALSSDFIDTPYWFYDIWYYEDLAILVPILIFIAIIMWVTSEGSSSRSGRGWENLGSTISKMFGGR